MPRIRSIKPQFASDEKLTLVSRDARLTYVLIWTQSDDEGLLGASTRQLLGELYPLDDTVTGAVLESWIAELLAIKVIRMRETRDGARVIETVKWKDHQRIDRPQPSKLRALLKPLAAHSTNDSTNDSRLEVGVGVKSLTAGSTHRSVLGRSASTIRVDNSSAPPADQPPPAEPQPPAPLSSREDVNGNGASNGPRPLLPEAAFNLLAAFYRRATPERYADVLRQLGETLTDGGTRFERDWVRAVDDKHLEWACVQTIRAGPQDHGKAIVFVLKKLRDTRLEVLSARTKVSEARPPLPAET